MDTYVVANIIYLSPLTRISIGSAASHFSHVLLNPSLKLSVSCRRDTHSYCSKAGPAWSSATNAIRGGAAGSHGSGPYLTGPTAPDPHPAWGRVRRRHVSLRKGSSELTAEASDPLGGPRPPTSVRTSHAVEPTYHPGGPEPRRVPQARAQARARVFRWKTRPPTAFNAGGCGVLCHCGARGSLCQATL